MAARSRAASTVSSRAGPVMPRRRMPAPAWLAMKACSICTFVPSVNEVVCSTLMPCFDDQNAMSSGVGSWFRKPFMLPYTSGEKPMASMFSRSAARQPGLSPSASVSRPRSAKYEPVVTWNSEFIVTTGNPAARARSITTVEWITSPLHSNTRSECSTSSSIELVTDPWVGKSASAAGERRVSTFSRRMSGACFITMCAKLRAMKPVPDRPMRGSGRFLLVILFGGGGNRPVPQETGPAGDGSDQRVQTRVEAVAGGTDDAVVEQALDVRVGRRIDVEQGHGAKIGTAFARERQFQISIAVVTHRNVLVW